MTATAADADLAIQPVPNPGNEQPVGAMKYLAKTFPGSTDAVGIFTGDDRDHAGRRGPEQGSDDPARLEDRLRGHVQPAG